MNIIEALKQVTERIWSKTEENLNEKVDKISGKSLSTNDYTTADKQAVSTIPTELTLLDGKLYMSKNGELLSSGVTLPSGSGSGSVSSNAITLTNLLESNLLTVAMGQEANLKFSFESNESDANGMAYIYVNNNLKASIVISPGDNIIDVSNYITEGTNEVKLTCTDIFSNSKSLSYSINAMTLKITSTLDSSQIYSGNINVRYTPYGAIEKTIFFIIDNQENTVVVTETGKQQTYIISAMSHGVHTLKIYATAVINGVLVKSNELNYDIMCVEGETTTPMIASSYTVKNVTQGELVNIPFIVYDPLVMNTDIILTIKCNGEIYYSASRNVDRTLQYWTTRDYPVGNEVIFTITYGTIHKSHILTVTKNNIDVAVKTTDLEFQLKSAGRSNEDSDRDTWISGDVTTTFEYINWESTGWVQDNNGDVAMRLSGDSKATINFMPFATDARQTGRTLEMCYAIRDVNNRDAVAISCLSDGIGFTVTADTCTLRSEQSEISCNYIDEEKIYITFVIEPRSEHRVMYLYINGVMSGAVQYLDNDNLQQSNPVAITIGSEYCAVDMYMMRSYNTALTMYEVVDNYIADITDVGEKLLEYEDNDIYDDFGNLDYNDLKDKIPICIITGSLPTYKGDKKKVTFSYSDPFNPSLDFEESNVTLDIQGTSSQYYNKKNWKIKMPNAHAFDLNQIPSRVACLKTDYAESTSRNNVMIANYVHTLYGDAKTPPQIEDSRVRTTIYGRPAILFHRETSSAPLVFYGKFNTNADKGSEEVYGFDSEKYPLLQCVEFCNNVSESCLFHENIPDEWSEDFEFRFPDGHSDISVFKKMHDWVVSTYQGAATNHELSEIYIGADGDEYTHDTAKYRLAKFKKEFTNYFDIDFCLVYYVLTFAFLCVDQRCKNMMMLSFDGKIFMPIFYDNDTAFSIGNTGRKTFDAWTEDHDQLDGANVYNGATSSLWVNFREAFPELIDETFTEWRSSGLFTYDKIIEYGIDKQTAKWCLSIYNQDSTFKYLSDLYENNDSTYLYQIKGNAEADFRAFIKNRIAYLDSKWCCGDYPADYISLRIYTPMDENNNPILDLPVPANPDVTVTTFSDTYAGIQYGAGSEIRQYRVEQNTPIALEWTMNGYPNDLETAVFPASQISSLGDLSPLYCGTVNLSKATKLTEVVVGSNVEGYKNSNLIELSVGTNRLLRKIDVQNCPNLTAPLALSGCPNIQEIYAQGSSITGVELPSSGYLKKIYLPETLTNLTITNQKYIEEFVIDGFGALTTLHIEDVTNVPVEEIMLNAPNLNRIRLIDVNWEAESEEAFSATIAKFENAIGMDASENNIGKPAVVTGRVKIDSISDELFAKSYSLFPDLVIDDNTGKPFVINFLDRNGESLYSVRVEEGANVTDPIEAGIIERPADLITDEYTYEFVGWSSLPTNVHQSYRITPVYKTKYAIKYYNEDELVYDYRVYQGEAAQDPVEAGFISAPIKEGTDDLRYMFSGWDNIPTNVQSATKIYAQFTNVYPVRYYATSTSTTPHYVQWIAEGSDAYDPVVASECDAPSDIITPEEKKLVFSEWDSIPTAVSAICQVYAQYDTYWAARFWNGNNLYLIEWALNGTDVVEPKDYFEDYVNPTKTSTAQYDFAFSSWSGNFDAITEARDYNAVYNNILRKYNVYFYNDTELMQTKTDIPYGSSTTYTGSTPIKLGVDNPEEYVFKGWLPTPEDITGETSCYALFKFTGYLFGKLAQTEDTDQGWGTVDNPNWDAINSYWETIALDIAAYQGGTMTEEDFTAKYPVGGRMIIPINLADGATYADVEIIAHNHDNLADDSGKAALTFFCVDLPQVMHRMNETSTNEGGYEASEMREFVNGELLAALPENLKTIIKPVYKISDGGSTNKTLITTTDSCWLASYDEVGLTAGNNNLSGQGELYSSIFSSNRDTRKKYITDDTATGGWWLRSSYYSTNSNSMFWRVTNSGGSYSDIAFNAFYVAFGFCI